MRAPWTRQHVDVRTDRELTQLFSEAAQALEPDVRRLDLARAKVATNLARAEVEGGSLGRRLALGSLGGGALWATALGTAAAHKAAAIAVVGGLLVGGVVAEQSGVGPAVRETVGLERAFDALTSQDDSSPATPASAGGQGSGESAQATELIAPTATLPAAAATVVTSEAPAGLPGQLRTAVRAGGDFNLRAVLEGYDAGSVRLSVAGEAGGAAMLLALAPDAELHVPGKPGTATGTDQLAGYLGRLVVVQGHCEAPGTELAADAASCSLTRLQVLGGPAQSGPPVDRAPNGRGASDPPGQGASAPDGPQPQGGDGDDRTASGPKDDETGPAGETGPPEHSSAGGRGNNKPQ